MLDKPDWLGPACDRLKEVGLEEAADVLANVYESKWISVKDRLPTTKDDFLVCNLFIRRQGRDFAAMCIGRYLENAGEWLSVPGDVLLRVTHWQERPAYPEGIPEG